MEVFEAVKTMLAVRSYQPKQVPEDVVWRILESGRLTASSKNRQAWYFIVVRQRERLEQLGRLARTGGYIAEAPMVVAVLVADDRVGRIDGARSAQDMMLTGWQNGLGSNWVGNVDTDEIRQVLDVPEGYSVLTIIPFGFPEANLGKGIKDRKPLADVAHMEHYGRSFVV